MFAKRFKLESRHKISPDLNKNVTHTVTVTLMTQCDIQNNVLKGHIHCCKIHRSGSSIEKNIHIHITNTYRSYFTN